MTTPIRRELAGLPHPGGRDGLAGGGDRGAVHHHRRPAGQPAQLSGEEVGDVGPVRGRGGGLSGGRRGRADAEGGAWRRARSPRRRAGSWVARGPPEGSRSSSPSTSGPAPGHALPPRIHRRWRAASDGCGNPIASTGTMERMTELPRKAAARTARLAALPLGYAGRQAMGLGKRLGGKPADAVLSEVQQRTAEQLFRTLGELKGGAMKFGQALSVLESALPEEVSRALPRAPHRAAGLRSPDADGDRARAADRPPRRRLVRAARLARRRPDGGRLDRAGPPRPLARPRGRASGDERDVAVKVQYPGAGEALMSDLRQISRVARGVAPVFPGIDIKPLVAELQDARRRRARLPPRGGGAGGVRRGLRRPPRHRRARGGHRRRARCS